MGRQHLSLLDFCEASAEEAGRAIDRHIFNSLAPENPVATEIHRRDSNYQKVLDRLRRGPATNRELNAICFRYGGRIHEMRQNGLNITTERKGRGVFVFTLKDDNAAL